jgi:hypothetical protein
MRYLAESGNTKYFTSNDYIIPEIGKNIWMLSNNYRNV